MYYAGLPLLLLIIIVVALLKVQGLPLVALVEGALPTLVIWFLFWASDFDNGTGILDGDKQER